MEEHFTGFAKKNTTRPDDMCMIFEEYLQELSCLDILLYPELETKQGNEDRNFTSIEVSFKLRMHGPFSRWRNLTKTARSHLSTIALLCTRKQQSGGFQNKMTSCCHCLDYYFEFMNSNRLSLKIEEAFIHLNLSLRRIKPSSISIILQIKISLI